MKSDARDKGRAVVSHDEQRHLGVAVRRNGGEHGGGIEQQRASLGGRNAGIAEAAVGKRAACALSDGDILKPGDGKGDRAAVCTLFFA